MLKKELAILGLGNAIYMENARRDQKMNGHKYFQEMLKLHTEAGFEEVCYDNMHVKAKFSDRRIGLYHVPFGLSYSSMTQSIIKSADTEAVAGVGFCGAVRPEIAPGTVIIAREAALSSITTEDAEWKEKLNWGKADARIADTMERRARALGYETKHGRILTVINPDCETPDFVREAREAGFDGVEMETAMLYQMANAVECPVAAILYVSDNKATHNDADVAEEVRKRIKAGKHIEMAEIARDAMLEVFKETE